MEVQLWKCAVLLQFKLIYAQKLNLLKISNMKSNL